MSFRNNGRKRDPKYIFSSAFLIVVGVISLMIAAQSHFSTTWSVIVGLITVFLGILMFKNSNEL